MKKTSMKNILSGKASAPTKKKTAKKARTTPVEAMPYTEPKSVHVTRADNGLTVRSYGKDGEKIKVAKSTAEAMRHCKDMLDC